MVDKADVVKTTIKSNKKKSNNGVIYGTINEVTDFYPLINFPYNANEKEIITLKQKFDDIEKKLEEKNKQIKTLKEIIQHDRSEIKKIKTMLKKYGLL